MKPRIVLAVLRCFGLAAAARRQIGGVDVPDGHRRGKDAQAERRGTAQEDGLQGLRGGPLPGDPRPRPRVPHLIRQVKRMTLVLLRVSRRQDHGGDHRGFREELEGADPALEGAARPALRHDPRSREGGRDLPHLRSRQGDGRRRQRSGEGTHRGEGFRGRPLRGLARRQSGPGGLEEGLARSDSYRIPRRVQRRWSVPPRSRCATRRPEPIERDADEHPVSRSRSASRRKAPRPPRPGSS